MAVQRCQCAAMDSGDVAMTAKCTDDDDNHEIAMAMAVAAAKLSHQ